MYRARSALSIMNGLTREGEGGREVGGRVWERDNSHFTWVTFHIHHVAPEWISGYSPYNTLSYTQLVHQCFGFEDFFIGFRFNFSKCSDPKTAPKLLNKTQYLLLLSIKKTDLIGQQILEIIFFVENIV